MPLLERPLSTLHPEGILKGRRRQRRGVDLSIPVCNGLVEVLDVLLLLLHERLHLRDNGQRWSALRMPGQLDDGEERHPQRHGGRPAPMKVQVRSDYTRRTVGGASGGGGGGLSQQKTKLPPGLAVYRLAANRRRLSGNRCQTAVNPTVYKVQGGGGGGGVLQQRQRGKETKKGP